MQSAELRKLEMLASQYPTEYKETKEDFKRLRLKYLRELSKLLVEQGKPTIRFNAGGPAVCGDAILHGETVYMDFSPSVCGGEAPWFYFRRCSEKDQYGAREQNRIELFSDIHSMKELARRINEWCGTSVDAS